MSEAMDDYRNHLLARGLAENTMRNNLQVCVKAHQRWGDIQIGSITGVHIDRLFRAETWGPSTRNLYLGSLRQFFKFCRREGHMARDFDPTEGWGNSRTPRVEKMRLPLAQFPDLLDACDHPRDRAFCALGLFTFQRGGEIQTLRVKDYRAEANELTIWRHKTSEADVLPVSVELAEELDRWFRWYRKDRSVTHLDPDWFLVSAKGPNPTRQNPLTRRIEVAVGELARLRPDRPATHPYRAVQRALANLGYPTLGEGEHTLRRSGARALFDTLRDSGYDGALMRVSSMLGHADTRVTERYIGMSLERTQRNEMIAGKVLFPSLRHQEQGKLIEVEFGGHSGT
jgi:integrase